jgi:hypothetical protein
LLCRETERHRAALKPHWSKTTSRQNDRRTAPRLSCARRYDSTA